MINPNTNGDAATCASFRYQGNYFSVYRDATAQSLAPVVRYKRRDDGRWTDNSGMHIAPALNVALQEAYATLIGEGETS